MQCSTYVLGPLETNGYLLTAGNKGIFIDPGAPSSPLQDTLKEQRVELSHIINTHLHCDHTSGNAFLADATGATVYANPADDFLLESQIGRGGAMGLPTTDDFTYTPLTQTDMTLLGEPCMVLETPGHSPGSLSLYFPDSEAVFVGDLLFHRAVGRTDLPGGDTATLQQSVREKIFTLPANTTVYCGHGPATTVGSEKAHNPFFAE